MATGNMTTTTHAVFIPEIWSKKVKRFREAKRVMAGLVNRTYEGEIQAMGDTVHIPNVSELSVGDKAANTDVSFETITETSDTITIDKHKYAAFKVEDIVAVQSNTDLQAEYSQGVGYALAKQVDIDLLALYSGLSQSVGSAGTDITDANLLRAIQYLDDADAPEDDRSLVMKPSQKKALLTLDKFVRADAVGYMAASSPIVTGLLQGGKRASGFWGDIYGVHCYITTLVRTTGTSPVSTHNLLFHRSAFALAEQKAIRVQSDYNIRSLADETVGDVLYGVAELRDDHAVRILT